MSSTSSHLKKSSGDTKKPKKPVTDGENGAGSNTKSMTDTSLHSHEKSTTTLLREIKATFDFKGPKDFQKIRILGKGGVGRVYLVQLKGTEKLFAMKVLRQEEMISRNKVKRVLTEREVLATAKHPLIISLYYSFQSRSRIYFVMDYCAGGEFYGSLQMQPKKCLTEDQMRFYAAEVLLALEYLHAMGFVYRDLKPENILLHASGHIRLTDFDLSKAAVTPVNAHVVESIMGGPKTIAEPMLVTNSLVGTEEYIAPEVIHGNGYGASVDWWTFGILMYEMLYGATPFRGRTRNDTFCRIEKSQLKFPDHPRCSVSKDCKNLIKKLLTHDPKKRLGSEQGAIEIKAHPFFKDINLQLILNSKPPIIPDISGPSDFRYFSNQIVDDDKDDEDMEFVNPDELDDDHPFKAFAPIDVEMRKYRSSSPSPSTSSTKQKSSKKSLATPPSESEPASPETLRKAKSHSKKNSSDVKEKGKHSPLSTSNETDPEHQPQETAHTHARRSNHSRSPSDAKPQESGENSASLSRPSSPKAKRAKHAPLENVDTAEEAAPETASGKLKKKKSESKHERHDSSSRPKDAKKTFSDLTEDIQDSSSPSKKSRGGETATSPRNRKSHSKKLSPCPSPPPE